MILKRNKEFNDKCQALKNRIQILKKEEEVYKNQLRYIKKREQQDRLIHNDKIKIKIELEKMKLENNKELLKKKERIQRFKIKTKNRLEEKKNENISQKKRKYQSALNDKYLMKCIIEQINTQQNNRNCYQHAKIRQQFNESETKRMKQNIIKENRQQIEHENNLKVLKNLEKKMMHACSELEHMEKKCLESLNKTKDNNIKYIENNPDNKSKYYLTQKIFSPIRNINKPMEVEYNDKKLNHSILSPSIKSTKNDANSFTQSSSVSNFRTRKLKQNGLFPKRNNDNLKSAKKGMNRSFVASNKRNKNAQKIQSKNIKTNNEKQKVNKNKGKIAEIKNKK